MIAIGESQRLQFRAARRNLRRCVKLHTRLHAQHPKVYAADLAGSLMNLGVVLEQLLQFSEADKQYGKALTIYEEMTPDQKEVNIIDYIGTLNNRGVLLRILAQPEAARAYHQQAIDLLKEFVTHSETDVREQIASTFNNIGIAFNDLKLLDDAIKAHRFSLKLYRKIAQERDPPDLRDVEKVATALINSSRVYFAAEQFDEALKEAEEAWGICEPQSLPPFVRMAAKCASLLGKIHAHQKQWNKSLDSAETAVAKFAQLSQLTREPGSPAHVAALNNLGNILDQLGRAGDAEAAYRESLQLSDQGQQSSLYYGVEERLAVLRNLVRLLLIRFYATREANILS